MSERTDITEQDVDFVLAVLRTRYPEDTREPPRDRLRQALVDGWWSIEEQRAVASVALAASQREAERLREALRMISDHGWTFDGRHTYTINCDDAHIDPRKFMEVIDAALRPEVAP